MASKTKVAPKKGSDGKKKELVPSGGNLPASLAGRMAKDSGKGVSTRQEDNLVPMITILQKMSPQCEKKDPKYMDGADAGVIWLKGADDPLVSGEDGIVVQPCHFDGPDWVEWKPNRGGFVARHPTRPSDASEMVDAKTKKKSWVRKNGNEVVETRYHTVRVFKEDGTKPAYVIPLSSTGHTVSKDWMFRMNNTALPSGEKAPSFACLWKLSTRYRENDSGNWYQFQVERVGWVESVEDYEQGLSLFTAFDKGEKKADMSQMADEASASDSSGRM